MEETTYLPVALFIPGVAILGIFAVVIAASFVLRRRRRRQRMRPEDDLR